MIKFSNQLPNPEKFDFQAQFEINKSIFKANFVLIMNLISYLISEIIHYNNNPIVQNVEDSLKTQSDTTQVLNYLYY